MIKRLIEKFVQYSALFKELPQNKHYPDSRSRDIFFSSNLTRNHKAIVTPSMDSPKIVDFDTNDDRIRALNICREHLGGAWTNINIDDFSLTPISGGMSNSIYCCSLPETMDISDGEPNQVLLRFYGHDALNSDIDIQVEIFNLLSLNKLGPKLYGKFEEGRIEEFLPASSLTCDELMNREISLIIAKKLASVHNLDVPIKKDNSWLAQRYNEFFSFIEQQNGLPEFSEDTSETTKLIADKLLTIDFSEEIKFILGVCDRTTSPLVFSHNDLHQGNILLAKNSKRRPTFEERIVFIDFEYCSYNYRAYDIANHFSEWCFEYDTQEYPHFIFYEDRLPSKETQKVFAHNYLEQKKLVTAARKDHETNGINDTHNNCNGAESLKHSTNGYKNVTNGYSNGVKHHISELDSLLEEIKPFFMSANLLWTLWSIKSAYQSNIKFGFWEHALARWQLYSSFKASLTSELDGQTKSEK